jgi:hypothetical protein
VVVRALEVERHDTEVERKIRRGRPLAEVTKLLARVVEVRKRG